MKKHQFKPFDQVLVRNGNGDTWAPSFFGFIKKNVDQTIWHHCTDNVTYQQCIPYNEQTAHLIGTSDSYQEPEPKVWYVTNIKDGEAYEFTRDEFEHFIKTAVLNNKDITDFNARYVNN